MERARNGQRVSTWLALAASACLLAACGGGGGDASPPEDQGQVIAATPADYWAAGTGSKWVYQVTDRRSAVPAPASATTEDLGEETVAGRTVRRFEHSWSPFGTGSDVEYRYFDGREVRIRDTDPTSPFADYAELTSSLRTGVDRKVVEFSERGDFDGDGLADTAHYTLRILLTLEDIRVVPAGNFRNVLRARQQLTINYTLSRVGNQSQQATYTVWYAPKVGVIRTEFEDPFSPAPFNTLTEELTGFSVGSLRAGVQGGGVLLENLGFASSGTMYDAQPQYAIAGDRIMVVSRTDNGTVQGAIISTDGTPVWQGTVLQPSGPQFTMLAPTVTFDGTGFRVSAASSLTIVSPGEFRLHGQRVSLTGQLADGPNGKTLDTGTADLAPLLYNLQSSARNGQLLLVWTKFDGTSNLVGRLFDQQNDPVAATFQLGAGVTRAPGAVAAVDTGFVVVDGGGDLMVNQPINSWLIAANGIPVSTVPRPLVTTPDTKRDVKLTTVDNQLWLSYSERGAIRDMVFGIPLDPLGAVQTSSSWPTGGVGWPSGGPSGVDKISMGIGSSRLVTAWGQGSNVQVRTFDKLLLTGMLAPLAEAVPVVPADGPVSHRMVAALALDGNRFLVAWTDGTPSEKLLFSLVLPRYIAP